MAIGSTGNAELRMHQNRFFQTWMFKIYFQCPLNIEKAYCFLPNKKYFIYRNYWVWLCSYFNQIISYTFACGLIICSYCKNLYFVMKTKSLMLFKIIWISVLYSVTSWTYYWEGLTTTFWLIFVLVISICYIYYFYIVV